MKKVHAILTADWHLREDIPTCRTDDFEETQWRKVKYISDLQKKYRCPVIHSGDLFDYWKPSPALLSKAIENLPSQFYSIYGNHDLPQHNIELASKSGLHCLVKAGVVKLLHHQGDWNYQEEELKPSPILSETYPLLVLHTMTYQGALPYPGCKDLKSIALLRKYPDAQLILTGHNHKPFVEEWEVGDLVMENFIYSPRVCLISDFVDNEYITQYIDVDNELITTTSKRGSFSRIGEYDKLLFINNVKNKNYKIENHKIVKWRAHELEEYIYINETLSITSTHDTNTPIDNERFKIGNYFNPECTEYVENIIKTIKDIYIK